MANIFLPSHTSTSIETNMLLRHNIIQGEDCVLFCYLCDKIGILLSIDYRKDLNKNSVQSTVILYPILQDVFHHHK